MADERLRRLEKKYAACQISTKEFVLAASRYFELKEQGKDSVWIVSSGYYYEGENVDDETIHKVFWDKDDAEKTVREWIEEDIKNQYINAFIRRTEYEKSVKEPDFIRWTNGDRFYDMLKVEIN